MKDWYDPLLEALFDGRLGDEQLAQLDARMAHDADLRAQYRAMMEMHATLEWEVRWKSIAQPALETDLRPMRMTGWRIAWRIAAMVLLLASIAGAMLGVWVYQGSGRIDDTREARRMTIDAGRSVDIGPAEDRSIAVLGEVQDAVWEDSAWPLSVGSPLSPGLLKLKAGVAQIIYYNGVTVLLEGPSEFDLHDPMHGDLKHGKLTAQVPTRAHGFTIATPSAHVKDLGTEFGVQVDDVGRTTVAVFTGRVEAEYFDARDQRPRTLTLSANEGRRIGLAGSGEPTNVAVRSLPFVRHLRRTVSLVDLVAGGDGSDAVNGPAHGGINPLNGARVSTFGEVNGRGSGRYLLVVESPCIDGVFVPTASDKGMIIDSMGGRFMLPTKTDNNALGAIWARKPRLGDARSGDWLQSIAHPSPISPQGAGLIGMHANAGITFDLAAMRELNPGWDLAEFTATVANVENVNGIHPQTKQHVSADVFVLVDGQSRFEARDFNSARGVTPIHVTLSPDARYLTLIASDGGNGYAYDWLVFGDALIDLQPGSVNENN
ncbi:MAG: hypothetical protein GC162_07855 [Planctomycetes bacterium]|nr:hypothetical protein [Planctomycetota bacterium]